MAEYGTVELLVVAVPPGYTRAGMVVGGVVGLFVGTGRMCRGKCASVLRRTGRMCIRSFRIDYVKYLSLFCLRTMIFTDHDFLPHQPEYSAGT